MLCAKGHFLCALSSHCGPMMISIKGLQCMQKATCISYLISALMAGIWWPISMACIICEEPNLTLCIAYDDLYQGSVICAKGHLLLACSLHSMQAYDIWNACKGISLHSLCTHCRPMISYIRGLQYVQRAISCTFSTLVVGLLWPVFKCLQCEKKPSPNIVHDQHCNPMVAVFTGPQWVSKGVIIVSC